MHKIRFFEDPHLSGGRHFLVDSDGDPTYVFAKSKEQIESWKTDEWNIVSVREINVWDYGRTVSVYIRTVGEDEYLFCLPITNGPKTVVEFILYEMGWSHTGAPEGTKWASRMSGYDTLDKCWHSNFKTFDMHSGGFYRKNEIEMKDFD